MLQERHLYDACPLCDGTDFEHFMQASCAKHAIYNEQFSAQINWNSCGSCKHVFTDGYFTEEASDILFGKTLEHQRVGHNLEGNRQIAARIVDKVVPFQSDGRWMDVGFGNGALLFAAKEYGFHPIGVDLRADNVKLMQGLNIEAYCEDIHTLKLPEPVQVVSMMDVLEHVPFPRTFLTAVVDLLDNGGVCMLSMPNTEQILWDVMSARNANPYWGELEHYHNFSRTRLYGLLEDVGLKPLRYGVSERYKACMEVVARKA
jgi:SAM-dependent methyltransferase